jgi:hypothetical protein
MSLDKIAGIPIPAVIHIVPTSELFPNLISLHGP